LLLVFVRSHHYEILSLPPSFSLSLYKYKILFYFIIIIISLGKNLFFLVAIQKIIKIFLNHVHFFFFLLLL
jgi:hypothetical protein